MPYRQPTCTGVLKPELELEQVLLTLQPYLLYNTGQWRRLWPNTFCLKIRLSFQIGTSTYLFKASTSSWVMIPWATATAAASLVAASASARAASSAALITSSSSVSLMTKFCIKFWRKSRVILSKSTTWWRTPRGKREGDHGSGVFKNVDLRYDGKSYEPPSRLLLLGQRCFTLFNVFNELPVSF